MGSCVCAKNKPKTLKRLDSNKLQSTADKLGKELSESQPDEVIEKQSIPEIVEIVEEVPPRAVTPPAESEPTLTLPCGQFFLPELVFYDFDSGLKSGEFDRSRPTDWQNILKSFFNFTYANIYDIVHKLQDNPVVHSYWDKKIYVDLPAKLLTQPPMEWFKEQIFLLKRTLQPGNDMGKVSIQRKIIQLFEEFKWFVWSVGSYFYISISNGEKIIGKTFTEASGLQEELSLPKHLKDWKNGFRYKNVRFKLVHALSDEGRLMRAEIKSMKIFSLSYGQVVGTLNYFIMYPMIVQMRIGPFLLFAVPIYPQNFLTDAPPLNMDIFLKPINIPETNVFRILFESEENRNPKQKEMTTCYLMYNFYTFVPQSRKIQYLCLISAAGKEMPVCEANYSGAIPQAVLVEMIYGEDYKGPGHFIVHESKVFGWHCFVYSEENPQIHRRNERASLFGKEIIGEAVVSLQLNKKNYKRFPVYNLQGKKLINILRKNIKECMNTLETSEDIWNINSLKELIHRKGLNYRHEWIIYSKCRNEKAMILLECDLLARAVWKVLNAKFPRNLNFFTYRDLIIRYLNPIVLYTSENYDQFVFLALFMERLKALRDATKFHRAADTSASRIINPFKEKKHSFEYLCSTEMLENIISVGNRYPAQFLEAIEYHCHIQFHEDLISSVKCDGYFFISRDKRLDPKDIIGFNLSINGLSSLREDNCITLLGFLERGGPKGNDSHEMLNQSFSDWVSDANVELVNKEEEHHSLELVLPCDLYSYCNSSFFREFYEFPTSVIIEEWSNCVGTLVKDLITVDGGESVLIEILIYLITQRYFSDTDSMRCGNLLLTIKNIIDESVFVPAEIVISYYLWNAICLEQQSLAQSEQNYISSLVLMTKLIGDPRGRKNRGIPWQMLASWKISQIARESHRLPDAMAAEEHFDSVFMWTKEFQQNLAKILKARYSSSKQAEIVLKHPFDHWSIHSDKRDSLVPESFDEFYTWMINHSLTLYSTGKLWSNLYSKLLLKGTTLPQLSTSLCLGMSGASTPVSFRGESRKALQQSSLTQILVPENGALNMNDLKGVAYIWGTDRYGQLGLALADEEEVPDQVTLPYPRMLTSLKDYVIKEISAGAEHCIAITIEGLCFAWGKNDNNQLGLGPDNPGKVSFPVPIKSVSQISKACCGYEHTVLLGDDCRVYTMGLGEGGVLGHGNVLSVMYPKVIQSLKNIKIKQISCGGYHTTALDKDGHLYVWGRGEGGQLGLDPEQLRKTMSELKIDSSEVFIHMPQRLFGELGKKKIALVACGEAHTLALTEQNEVFGWGWGSNGQLGRGFKHDDFEEIGNKLCIQYLPGPISFPENTSIKHIAAGGLFSMFITDHNEVLACGMNDFGQLGIENPHRDHTDISFPTKLDCFSDYPIHYLVCGENHTVAVSKEKETMTWAWGRFREGQLGLGEVSPSATPRPVQTLNNAPVYRVACGRRHTFAVIGEPEGVVDRPRNENLDFTVIFVKK